MRGQHADEVAARSAYLDLLAIQPGERDGLSAWIELYQGDALALPFPERDVDLALAATVLRHIPGGHRGIAEMARVVRPGGRVAVFEGDTDSCSIAHPDRELTRRIVVSGTDDTTVDGQLARRLPGLLVEAGLENVQAQAFTTLDRDPDGFYAERSSRWAHTAAQAGAIDATERDRWLEELRREQDAGRYLVAQVQIFAWGQRPAI